MAHPINIFPDSKNAQIGDHSNFSAVGGNQITNNNTGSGAQNNNNAAGVQNVSYGRDQNLNHGVGPMTIDDRGQWKPTAPRPEFPPRGSGFSNNDERNRRDFSPPVQATSGDSAGRGQHQLAQSPGPSDGIPNPPRPSSGNPYEPSDLVFYEKLFRMLIDNPDQREYEDIVRYTGKNAQEYLDDWQRLSECTAKVDLRSRIVQSAIRLSDHSGLSPRCLQISGVEDLSEAPVEYGGVADIWRGSIGDVRVAVKVVRHRPNSHEHDQMIK
ncbi:hypothetical protein AAF712_015420, partial [Marasmius tenuissimus]